MRRICLILATILCLLMIFNSCAMSKDTVHVKNNEKEVALFSQKRAEVTLKITVTDAGKEETFEVRKTLDEDTTLYVKLDDIASDFFGENAVISDVTVENVTQRSSDIAATAFFLVFCGLIIVLAIIGMIVEYNDYGF